MILLHLLEFVLGSIDTWPTTILNGLFIEAPSLYNIKAVSAFFYGNGLPFHVAHCFYTLCNGHIDHRATAIMRSYYLLWQCLKYRNHLCIYYNTMFQKMIWINGRGLNQTEYVVVPNGYHVLLGIDGTDHPNKIISHKRYNIGISTLK
jgi:hypothetical protein